MESTFTWPLLKYARLMETGSDRGAKESWQHFDSTSGELKLNVSQNDRFSICQKNVVHESYVLSVSNQWLRGVARGDSLLILSKLQKEHRQFRIQFASTPDNSAISQCSSCVDKLASYFPIKRTLASDPVTDSQTFSQPETTEPQTQTADPQTQTTAHSEKARTTTTYLSGETSLADVARSLLRPSQYLLPSAYQQSNLSCENLEEVIWVCLSDSTFPNFVNEVDRVLQDLTGESE